MSLSKITQEEVEKNAISSLASHPSSPSLYSGQSLSAKELQAAFDRLPRLVAERFNALIDSLGLYTGEKEHLADCLATGLAKGHSLTDLFEEITNGGLSERLTLPDGQVLSSVLQAFKEALSTLKERYDELSYQYLIQDPATGAVYRYGLALKDGMPGILLLETYNTRNEETICHNS